MGLGLLFGYQGLVSSAGGALVPVVAIAILVTARSKLVAIRHLAVITLCALIVMGPWMYRNYLLFGAPILNTNGAHNFYQGNNPKATGRFTGSDKSACSAPGSLDTSLSHAAGLIEIAACHA